MQTKLLIDGELVAGDGAEVEVLNPATGEAITKIREASPDQVLQAVEAAGRAFGSWGNTTPQERSLLLLKLADRMEQDARTYADLESLNCGKPRARALGDEMPAIAMFASSVSATSEAFQIAAHANTCFRRSSRSRPNATSKTNVALMIRSSAIVMT
jgi:acyl-CoA reductase-like NAD-dependent aldehyde dehydrogenase